MNTALVATEDPDPVGLSQVFSVFSDISNPHKVSE